MDRGKERDPRKRRLMMIGLAIGVALFIALTVAGALVPVGVHVGG